jgi:methylmalonyl-CoA/ethylmalonyl-CoA epimerase
MKSKLTYVGIRVTDLERSIQFYTRILGMTVAGRGKIEQTKGETVGLQTEKDGFTLELNYYEKDSPFNTRYIPGEGLDHIAFKVDNLDEALAEAEKAGYRTVCQVKADGSRWVYIEDPDGIWIELF